MIRATSSIDGPAFTFNATVNGLAVYLDNWAVIDLAEGDPTRRRRFVNSLCSGGDLLFSFANVVELTGARGGSFDIVKGFLDEIGPHWFPVELNPFEVVQRELSGACRADSCVSTSLMTAYFVNRISSCPPRSGKVVDLSQDFFRLGMVLDWVARSESLPKHSLEFDDLLRTIPERRISYERNAGSHHNLPIVPFNPSIPATFACSNLIRTLILESNAYRVKKGDGLDFCHAVIASAFANVAALDKNWKRRVECLPKPNRLARIYSGLELDAMVTDIELRVSRGDAMQGKRESAQ
jgi:hypothetical protein